MSMFKRVEIKVPATTANLGPGFDCLGMALDLWNLVRLEVGRRGIVLYGEGADTLSRSQDNLVFRAVASVFQATGRPMPEMALSCRNSIPLARGLGSSAAAIVGGLLAANALCDEPLSQKQLLHLATAMEGHPDNVAAALLGGCQIVLREGDDILTASVPLPADLKAVLFIPDQGMPTAQARAILPREVSREDAVYNLSRVALLVSSLATGTLESLSLATQDRLHQPARQVLFPSMKLIFRAALDAGALGAFLSGAGSSILAMTRGREMTVGLEMEEVARQAGVSGTVRVTQPVSQGAHVVAKE
ncbi:MAG: homoserine kinase [Chloroflexi bacterium]|nr:homoserine kinase [Chloroflexota bacterium]